MHHIADMISLGYDVVVTHGNGPQVGFILRRSEISRHELHEVPLDYCGADTQGSIGYMFVQALHNEFLARKMDKKAVAVVTQTVVTATTRRSRSTKPIGSFMDEPSQEKQANDGWNVVEDAVAAGGSGCLPIPSEIVKPSHS
jgi:carbamate kinase